MPEASGGRLVEVAAAVMLRPGGEFLLAQRPSGKVYEGYWEFPGGKIEAGEPAVVALARELHEELGVRVTRAYPWITREHVYAHAHVRLRFFRVVAWEGEPTPREAQAFTWQRLPALSVAPVLPANGPVMRALALPPVLAITDAATRGESMLLSRLDDALAHGLRMVMVREKQVAKPVAERLVQEIVKRCRPRAAIALLNSDAPLSPAADGRGRWQLEELLRLARDRGLDGVHLTAAALMRSAAGRLPARAMWCGASCHDERELARAAELELDYVVLGPVEPTASHLTTPVLGWERFAKLVSEYPLPVYALGGMQLEDLETACAAGAHGVAMIRGAWSPAPGQSFPSDWPGSEPDSA